MWEEDSVMEQFVFKVYNQVNVGVGGFSSGNFINIFIYVNNIYLLIFYLMIFYQVVVNMVVDGIFIFDINFVVLVIIVGINQMFVDEVV